MASASKAKFLTDVRARFGEIRKLQNSESLFVIGEEAARIYIRYSKVHARGRTFFGLRAIDLRHLEGHNSYLCFLLDDGSAPLFIPFVDFEDVFANSSPANDGQHKVQLIHRADALELYIARQGRFNVEGYVGFETLEHNLEAGRLRQAQNLSHCQVQTLLAGIGNAKGYQVYIPEYDIGSLDWSLTTAFAPRRQLPVGYEQVRAILGEIDVVWVSNGGNKVEGLFEVEHSTAVYSGLLRFNDVLLTNPNLSRFSIVSNELRRSLFSRQLARPTFRKSGLTELCSFLEYSNVAAWHERVVKGASDEISKV